MYIALTEDKAKEIRKLGISVIEWKRCIVKNVNVAVYAINKSVEKAVEACNRIWEAVRELGDMLSFVIDEIKDRFHLPTSRRYKFVKILGNMGYNKQRVWTLTRHTWLARSNC